MVVLPFVPVTPISVIALAGSPSERPTSAPSAAAPDGNDDVGDIRTEAVHLGFGDLVLDDDRRGPPLDGLVDERVTIGANSTHRDEHVARLDGTRVGAHGAHLDRRIADHARAREAVEELAQGHALQTRRLPDFVHEGKLATP